MIVAFDVDGTLAEGPFDKTGPRGSLVRLVRGLQRAGVSVVVVTARPESFRSQLQSWLRRHAIPYNDLRMRQSGDNRADELLRADQTRDAAILFDDKYANCEATRAKCVLV